MTLQIQPWGCVEGIVEKNAATHGLSEIWLYDSYRGRYQRQRQHALKVRIL